MSEGMFKPMTAQSGSTSKSTWGAIADTTPALAAHVKSETNVAPLFDKAKRPDFGRAPNRWEKHLKGVSETLDLA